MPQGKRRSCHSIRFGFKLSNYTFINNEKTSILRLLERVLLRIPSNWNKGFQCLYKFVEFFCRSVAASHRRIACRIVLFFSTFLVRLTRKLKIQVGSVGRQLVLEGSLFDNDIFLGSYFLFEIILPLKTFYICFFVKEKIENLAREYGNVMNSIWRFICKRNVIET